MKKLLENQAHEHELSLLGKKKDTNKQPTNYRGFNLEDLLNIKISVNETAFNNFFNDFYQLQMEYEALKQQQAIEKQQFIQEKYAETLAKIYVEFGKTVYPVVQSYAHTLEYLTPNSKCDQSCLIDSCLRPGINTDVCFSKCNCTFDEKRLKEEV